MKKIRCIHHFRLDFINNMVGIARYRMVCLVLSLTISTICAFRVQNPHHWFLAKQSSLKSFKEMSQKYQKKLKPKGMSWNKSTKLQFQSISTRKILMLSKRYESTEVERRTWLHVLRRNSGPQAVTLTKWLKWCVHAIYMKIYLNIYGYILNICHRLNV